MKISIIGAGNVGGSLALSWAKAGHEVLIGARNPNSDKTNKVISENPDDPSQTVYGYSDGYNILKNNAHCTLRACKKGYIPENVKTNCQPSYNFCEKDINIQSQSIASIAVDCNTDTAQLVLPDWWNEERDNSFWDDAREPPFDKFPFNKLPMTRFPKKFNWKDINVRYLTYYTSSSSSLCCLCLLLIMSSLKRR